MASLLIGIGVEIIVTIFEVVVRTIPMPLTITFGIIGLAFILYGLVSIIRHRGKGADASQNIANSQAGRDMIQVGKVDGDLLIGGGAKPEEKQTQETLKKLGYIETFMYEATENRDRLMYIKRGAIELYDKEEIAKFREWYQSVG